MKAYEIFALIVRSAGLFVTLLGLHETYRTIIMLLQRFTTSSGSIVPPLSSSFIPALFGVPCLLLGVWFLRGAPWLVSFSYPEVSRNDG
jgi:hypothetical protein